MTGHTIANRSNDTLTAIIKLSFLSWSRELQSGYWRAKGERFEYWLDEAPPLFVLFYQRVGCLHDEPKQVVKPTGNEILYTLKYLEK